MLKISKFLVTLNVNLNDVFWCKGYEVKIKSIEAS